VDELDVGQIKTIFERGDIIEIDGLLAVVVGTVEENKAPEGHVSVWFGDPKASRISEGGKDGSTPEVWTIPIEYCTKAAVPKINH